MRILILGVHGMLGHTLFRQMRDSFDTYGTCRRLSDSPCVRRIIGNGRVIPGVVAEDIEGVKRTIGKAKPDAIVNCIGIIKQLESARDPARVIYVNALFPHTLAEICQSQGIRLIHFSTDCVFSGKQGMYRNDDPADAEDLYGRTKYLGEISRDGCVTIRSSVIGRELDTRNGLVEWFLAQRGKKVEGYRNAIYSGFTTNEMANIVSMILKDYGNLSGVWQIASKPISKYEILDQIRLEMQIDLELQADYDFQCDRSLDGSKFNEHTRYSPPSWESMIEEMIGDAHLYDKHRGD